MTSKSAPTCPTTPQEWFAQLKTEVKKYKSDPEVLQDALSSWAQDYLLYHGGVFGTVCNLIERADDLHEELVACGVLDEVEYFYSPTYADGVANTLREYETKFTAVRTRAVANNK